MSLGPSPSVRVGAPAPVWMLEASPCRCDQIGLLGRHHKSPVDSSACRVRAFAVGRAKRNLWHCLLSPSNTGNKKTIQHSGAGVVADAGAASQNLKVPRVVVLVTAH